MVELTSCSSEFVVLAFPFNESLNSTTIFMGDSITAAWLMPEHNAGIPGQTTAQMLNRFSADVVGHGFKRIVILGGTNDVLQRLNLSNISLNLGAIANIAESANIEVILCELPPITNRNEQTKSVNEEIAGLARSRGFLLVDYFTPLSGHPDFFKDGLHPNAMGYAVMEDALSEVVVK
jgi:lysophospholipase L1-like esterase